MIIKKVDIDSNISINKGFSKIQLNRLENVVAVVGKNGSGKSRLLDLIYSTANRSDASKHFTLIGNVQGELCQNLIYINNFNEIIQREQLISSIENICINQKPDDELQDFIEIFLNKPLFYQKELYRQRQASLTPTYGNRPFQFNELSPGEKKLFEWAFYLFKVQENKGMKISESILIIDEPELHLHPDAQVGLIDGIKRVIGKTGQLWIATHSVHILAHLNYSEIFMISKDSLNLNCILHPSRDIPNDSFLDLMNMEKYIAEFDQFITSIAGWAYAKFVTQCLRYPEAITTVEKNDPQVKLFKESLFRDISNDDDQLNLLDFGAGAGRIGQIIMEDNVLNKKINYYALEPEKKNRDEIQAQKIDYKEIFNDHQFLIEEKFFDYIVVCNVLHEIDPRSWKEIINKLIFSLKDNGYIIFIEDKVLPKGERIDNIGFLILDMPELKLLFDTEEIGQILHNEVKYKDRILCALISRKDISGEISKTNIINAINKLKMNTFDKIKDMNKNQTDQTEHDYEFGRKLAFYSKLYINADLALSILNPSEDSTVQLINHSNCKKQIYSYQRQISVKKIEPLENKKYYYPVTDELISKVGLSQNLAQHLASGKKVTPDRIIEDLSNKKNKANNNKVYLDLLRNHDVDTEKKREKIANIFAQQGLSDNAIKILLANGL